MIRKGAGQAARLAGFVAIAGLAACGGGNGSSDIIEADVSAVDGGTFSDASGTVTVVVPQGALGGDAMLRVASTRIAASADDPTFASAAFEVSLTSANGGDVSLDRPIKIVLRADQPPEHPTLGEISRFDAGEWRRVEGSFYRNSSQRVVGLSNRSQAIYRVSLRTLQATQGDAVARGRSVLMEETFGNEAFFGDVIGLHTLLDNVTPADAVALGVQVDIGRLPQSVIDLMTGSDLAAKDAALSDPATTRVLLQNDAVIGVRAQFDGDGNMIRAGLTCALCHVNVAPTEFQLSAGAAMLPIGEPQFDGIPNSRIDAGTILSLTPFVQNLGDGGATAAVLQSWGPGNFDIRALPDNALEDGVVNPTNNPPIWNFVDLAGQGYLFGWDGLFVDDGTNGNALASQAEAVYDLVMHGNGAFGTAAASLPAELSITPPQSLLDALAQAEADQPGNDITADKLLDLQAWMRSITSPAPGPFDETKAERGFELFHGEAGCSSCHQSADLTGPGLFTAITAPQGGLAGGIKVPSLRGISHTAPYLSDGSVPTLAAAVEGVLTVLEGLDPARPTFSDDDREALVEYLKSL
ncbi:MAG: c-type cytochrome [Zoogloeaceae bacterium]|nr:c-type cytochrome [Rhodocyclaceae bacterium]MCP5236924.1 c-type cytochrome [Zoogloeaceae bacterium]